ncbi:MAG: DUF3103 family protein [Oligoflexus sp.]
MRPIISSFLTLSFMLTMACDRQDTQSTLKEIASNANDTLLDEIQGTGELSLQYVFENQERYGLSNQEIQQLRAQFSEEEFNNLVLSFIDPNNLRGQAKPRWAYIPPVSDDDPSLSKIEAVSSEGRIDVIDGLKTPENIPYPLITLAFSEKPNFPVSQVFNMNDQAGHGSLMLDTIRFEYVYEPWIKGAAEVYMVVSYFDKNGVGATEMIELPSVDYDKRSYETRLISHIWNKNQYQIVNIAFFEHDSGHNYSGLLKAFTTAASGVITAVVDPSKTTVIAVAGLVNQLSEAVINALPKGAFTDDDDFMDAINTIEKYQDGERRGVGGNVTAQFRHFELKVNDE